MLSYYFYFFKGMYEMRRGNQDTAFHHLKLAEDKLDLVHDDIEKAEFHYKTGCLYYNIRSTLLSIHHLKDGFIYLRRRSMLCEKKNQSAVK
ncbi:hypothetical protein BsIDN1_67640 [Bacillus safensis]|uniref:Uncharacterized protein n=1 Tax=Bacillus safensis TaxID=561879 RepID=A0A5S9MN46_BACIA|nr:hypothetical protein BsIDN1_67640 [Bacillus safensis]